MTPAMTVVDGPDERLPPPPPDCEPGTATVSPPNGAAVTYCVDPNVGGGVGPDTSPVHWESWLAGEHDPASTHTPPPLSARLSVHGWHNPT